MSKQQQAQAVSDVLRVQVDPNTITPLGELVLLELLPEGTSQAGLVLPDSVKLRNRARVLRVGPGHLCQNGQRVPLGCKPGDVVIRGNVPLQPVGSLPNGNAVVLAVEGVVLAIDTAEHQATFTIETPMRETLQ